MIPFLVGTLVPVVHSLRNVSQVLYLVVRPILVDVVNGMLRPLAIVQSPSYSVCHKVTTSVLQPHITFVSVACDLPNFLCTKPVVCEHYISTPGVIGQELFHSVEQLFRLIFF